MRNSLLLLIAAAPLCAGQTRTETGNLTIHMILHAVGTEKYQIAPSPDGGLTLNTSFEYTDRTNTRTTLAELKMKADYTPQRLEIKGRPEAIEVPDSAGPHFSILGSSPFAIQMAMMRYWSSHGKPDLLLNMRGNPGADPIRITHTGQNTLDVGGHKVRLERYRIGNLMFGSEILWMNQAGDLAAAMTFAGGLPMEAVRTEYEPAFTQLYGDGVQADLANLDGPLPERTGAYAISGALLIDATGAAPVEDSVVIVRAGRIAAAGPRASVTIPKGMAVVDARGKTLMPGLWEMHTHYSGAEFGPASLGVGITTVRDCGGEFDYLVAQRAAIEKGKVVGPRMLLAGLIDAGGIKAFGHVTAETPEEGRAMVDRYHKAGFEQIKLYTFLQPDVIRAISAEAHSLGMTVTGHVPQVFNAYEGVEAGMDQINHLQYVTAIMRPKGAPRGEPIDLNSETAQKAIRFLKDHHTVVDPTASWGEMGSHSKEVPVESFEPGILKAPFVLDVKFRGMGGNTTAEQMRARTADSLAVIGALHKAGVTIVPGSDTGLVGYGLIRELELYVQAGMTPMEAIQCATIVSARAMNLDKDTGTIEAGKRADMVLVDGNPLVNFRDIRKIYYVITNGAQYDTAKLLKTAGFHP